jgi:hypothetical protein
MIINRLMKVRQLKDFAKEQPAESDRTQFKKLTALSLI